jgi:excisionase family DNA binding protein
MAIKVVRTIREAAKLLGVAPGTIREGMRRGEIPYRQLSARVYLIPRKALERFGETEGGRAKP